MTIETVYLAQDSQEWHEHRRNHFNASEAGAVMGVGKFKPRNPAELLAVKRGELVIPVTPAMTRGTELEPKARELAEYMTGVQFTPVVMRRGRYSASLDGLDFHGTHALEVKCPMSAESNLFEVQTASQIRGFAPHYWWQLVHQFYVSGVERITFCAYHPEVGATVTPVYRDDVAGDFDVLLAAWEAFGKHMDNGTSPDDEREDAEWLEAALAMREAQAYLKAAEEQVANAKARLIELGGGHGGGVSVTRVKGRTSVAYAKAIKELAPGADLSRWTTTGEATWKVEVK